MSPVEIDLVRLRQDLDNHRQDHNMTWGSIADQLGLSRAVMSRIKTGERKVTLEQFATIVKFLGQDANRYLKVVSSP